MNRRPSCLAFVAALAFAAPFLAAQTPAPRPEDLARLALPQHTGTLTILGLHQPVQVLRDASGVPHIYALDTHDLFFAQGFIAAQDHMPQMELWRRSAEGKLAEVLGPEYLQRDRLARTLAFRGDWSAEFRKYHPEGELIFTAFAAGINEAIRIALEAGKVPVEFQTMGFQPEPVWTAKTLIVRIPGGSTSSATKLSLPEGLNLDDLKPGILDLTKTPAQPTLVQLTAPGWNALGTAQPSLPGITTNPNPRWDLATLHPDQQDLLIVETNPADPHQYREKGQWLPMATARELIHTKGKLYDPEVYLVHTTLLGPVLYEDTANHRATIVRWPTKPGSTQYAALAPESKDLASTRAQVENATKEKLILHPTLEFEAEDPAALFERVQTDTFSSPRPISFAFGDYDNDGFLDLFVGYFGGMSKLFHNDGHGHFTDVSLPAGITDAQAVRSCAWGDFDGDGFLDLYVGYTYTASVPNRLYHNDGHGHFTDVSAKMGINDWGDTRQVNFVDFNNDGKVDLFVAFREKANRLYRNDGDHFTEVAASIGITGARSTVGAIWFDYNEDGKLDLFEANQNGKLNTVYRNDGDHFTEVAHSLGMDGAGRTTEFGSVGIAVGDFNNDGRLDLYYANYGPSWLFRNDGGGKFTDVAPQMGVVVNKHLVSTAFGDYDNDGKLDLYADGYFTGHENVRDYLFHNEGPHFTDATPGYMLKHDGDHGVLFVDYDQDGALDLVLADHETEGSFSLYHNRLPADQARHSLQVLVLDAKGHYTQAGAEVRLYKAGTREIISARLVDSGDGYDSQSAIPVHFGLPTPGKVDIEVTSMSNAGRKITRVENIDPWSLKGKPLIIKTTAP